MLKHSNPLTPDEQFLLDLFLDPPRAEAYFFAHRTSAWTQQILELAKQHKVLPDTHKALLRWGEDVSPQQSNAESMARMRQHILSFVGQTEHAISGDAKPIFVKGLGIERFYKDEQTRYFHDLDICFVSEKAFWNFGDFLQKNRFKLSTPVFLAKIPWRTLHLGGCRYALIEGQESFFEGIEAHLGPYCTGNRTFVDLTQLGCQLEWVQHRGYAFQSYDATGTFIVFLAEVMSRTRLIVRDYVDLSYLLREAALSAQLPLIEKAIETYQLGYAVELIAASFKGYGSYPVLQHLRAFANRRPKAERLPVGHWIYRRAFMRRVWGLGTGKFLQTLALDALEACADSYRFKFLPRWIERLMGTARLLRHGAFLSLIPVADGIQNPSSEFDLDGNPDFSFNSVLQTPLGEFKKKVFL